MDFEAYLTYNTADFLKDDYFIDSCIKPTENSNSYWEEFIKNYPHKEPAILQARQFISLYRKQPPHAGEERQGIVWKRIQDTLQHNIEGKAKIFRLSILLKAAAVLLIVSALGLGYWRYQKRTITLSTTYGQIKTIVLPDSSSVTLNGNSTLSYANNWNNKVREVWINGEGLFKVKHLNQDTRHIKQAERFIVHCEDMNVEVLGTVFNVKYRHSKANVGLISGKIRLDYAATEKGTNKSMTLKPGDYVEYHAKKAIKVQSLPDPVKLSSWTTRRFIFSNALLSDMVNTLQDDYGYKVKLTDPDIGKLQIEGEINVASVNELLETITTALHVNIYQNNTAITISSVNPKL